MKSKQLNYRDFISGLILLLLAVVLYKQFTPQPAATAPNAAIEQKLTQIEQSLTALQQSPAINGEITRVVGQANREISANDVFDVAEDTPELNEIKSRFEGLFVNYQYLKRCGNVNNTQYHILNSALMHELASNNAPARMQYDILTAAQGTYDEIYARSECDMEGTKQVQSNFDNYTNEAMKLGFVIAD